MVSLNEIINFSIFELGLNNEQTKKFNSVDTLIIREIKVDKEAESGDMAWISEKVAKTEPERINNYRGSLLIIPLGYLKDGDRMYDKSTIIECSNPKYVFLMIVRKFFPGLIKNKWQEEDIKLNIHPKAEIGNDVVLAPGVVVGEKVKIGNNVIIGPNTVIDNCVIKKRVIIGANCSIGLSGFGYEKDEKGKYWRFPHIGRVVIEENVEIGSNTCIDRGGLSDTVIHSGVKIDNLVHIAHNVTIGEDSLIIANSMIGGSTIIDKNVWLSPSASIMNHINIGTGAIIGLGAVVRKSVEPNTIMVGNPATAVKRKG